MPVPDFSVGEVLTAAAMDSVGMWKTGELTLSTNTGNLSDCFPADFQNFRLVVTGEGSQSAPASFYIQLRTAAGSTANTNYFQSVLYETTTAGPTRVYSGPNAQWEIGGASDLGTILTCDLFRPNEAARTLGLSQGTAWGSSAAFFSKHNFIHTTATAYTGLTWSVSTGTFSGKLRVYGYRN